MDKPTDAQIRETFEQVEEEEGSDKSTPYITQMTADRLGLEYMEVIDAMVGTPHEERQYHYYRTGGEKGGGY